MIGDQARSANTDVLILVEDPGAANFIVELPAALEGAGRTTWLMACGHARSFLRDRDVAFEELSEATPAGAVLDAIAPRLLLIGTSQNLDSPILAARVEARRRGLVTAGFVDMAADAELRFCGRTNDPLVYVPDWLFVADPATRAAFERLGFSKDRILVCGHPAYDRVRRRARELASESVGDLRRRVVGRDPSPRPVWLFAAEHAGREGDERLQRNSTYALHGRGSSDRRVDVVLEEVLDQAAAMTPRPFVILRLHPKNNLDEFLAYLSEVDLISAGGDPTEMIMASDLVIGLSSMLLMEAAQMDRQTLSVVPKDDECHWAPSVVAGLTPCVSTRVRLAEALAKPPSSEIPRAADARVGAAEALRDGIASLLL